MRNINNYPNWQVIIEGNGYWSGYNDNFELIFDGQGVHNPKKENIFTKRENGIKNFKAGYNVYPLPQFYSGKNNKILEKYRNFLRRLQKELKIDKLIIPNFKKIGPKIEIINSNRFHYNDVGLADGVIVRKLNKESIGVAGFVGDCAAIIANYQNEIIGILHVGWQGASKDLINKFIEELIIEIGDFGTGKELEKVEFFISPMAGNNYEFGVKDFINHFKSILEKYGIPANEIFKQISDDKGYLFLRKLIKILFEKIGINPEKQLYFHPADTNNPNNNRPSYRLFKQGKYPRDDRLATIGIIR